MLIHLRTFLSHPLHGAFHVKPTARVIVTLPWNSLAHSRAPIWLGCHVSTVSLIYHSLSSDTYILSLLSLDEREKGVVVGRIDEALAPEKGGQEGVRIKRQTYPFFFSSATFFFLTPSSSLRRTSKGPKHFGYFTTLLYLFLSPSFPFNSPSAPTLTPTRQTSKPPSRHFDTSDSQEYSRDNLSDTST